MPGVELVQYQLTQQRLELAFVAQQAQLRLVEHGLEQPVHGQFGNAVGDAQAQAQRCARGGFAHALGQLLAQGKNVVGLVQRGHTRFGQHQIAAFVAQQAHAQRLLQHTHLGADGLHGHVQALGGACHAAFLGHDPKVVQVAVVEALAHGAGMGGYWRG